MGLADLFGGLKGLTGEGLEMVNQGKELFGKVSEGMSKLLTRELGSEELAEIGQNLKELATTGRGLVEKLPECGVKKKMVKGLDMVMNLSPKVDGNPVSLERAAQGERDMNNWVTSLYNSISGENADQGMIDQVKTIINGFNKLGG